MTNLPLRRFLADAADPVPWQALSRAIERPVCLPPGAEATATAPPLLPAYEPPARPLSLAIVVPHMLPGGGERTSVLLAKHLSRSVVCDVTVFNRDPQADERSFAPYVGELAAAGVAYSTDLSRVGDFDVALWWGRAWQPAKAPRKAIYLVNAPSQAACDDVRWARSCGPRMDGVVAASVGAARMTERALEWPTGAVRVVWNGAEVSELDGLSPHPSEGGRFVLGYLGRFSDEKNLLSTVAALRLLPEHVTARFVGQGPIPIERAAKAWGVADRVEVLPPTGDRRGFYGGIDCFVLPSLYEATPTVVAEAMLAGVPVVASAVGDLPCILGGGRGLLRTHPTTLAPEAVAAGINCMTPDPDLRPGTGAARAFAREHLTAERMAAGYEAAIADVAK